MSDASEKREEYGSVIGGADRFGYTRGVGTGGGDSFGGDMEARITALEARVEHMSKSLDKLETSVDSLKTGQATLLERSTHLASKTFIGVVVGGGVAFLAALIGILKAIN